MRRHVLSRLDDLDLDARELATAAARRAGLSLEEWAAAVLTEQDDGPLPSLRTSRRSAGSDLDALITRMSPAPHRQPKRDYEALMAAVAAESERQAQDQASRTAIALESMASWIEQAETRLNDATRASTDQQDRIAAVLSQALSSLKDRLDTVERQVTSERAAPPRIEFPMDEALKALAPVSETLVGLRADMARVAKRLEQPAPDLTPAVETIRNEIDSLRSSLSELATRDEIAALDAGLGSIAKNLEQGPTTRDLRTLASSITVLYEQVQNLSEGAAEGLHQRIGREIDSLKGKIDRVAESGIDRSVIDFLSGQIVDMRQDLAHRAEPQQIGRLTDEIEVLGRQIAELRLHQVGKGDLTAIKNSLDDVCSALYVTATAQETARVPEQLEDLSRRLDLLVRRPDPAPVDLSPITEQLTLLTERMAGLSGGSGESAALTGMMDRLSMQMQAVAEREAPSHEPLMERFDRIEQELRQLGQKTDSADMAQMLRAIHDKLDRTPPEPAGLDALEGQIAAMAERLGPTSGETFHQAMVEATGHLKTLQSEAVGIAERAARAALAELRPSLPDTGDLDAIKHGFVELKALQGRSEKKTQETLRAVHDALEALVTRLPGQVSLLTSGAPKAEQQPSDPLPPADRLEAAVRRLHAATLSQVETTTSVEAAKAVRINHPEAKASEQTSPISSETGRGHVRASFIAAARRAAQDATPEPAASAPPSPLKQKAGEAAEAVEPTEHEAESAPSSLFKRLRRTLEGHRRPLLFGLAFLILAAGAAQILSSEQSNPGPVVKAAQPQAAAPAPETQPEQTASASAATEAVDLFQTSSLATASSAPAPLATGHFIVDPATISGIPAGAPAALRKAALAGDAAALYAIAARTVDGHGMAQDETLAAKLFERAAQAGFPPAQVRLAMMHEKGVGVARDLRQAAFWYERAALGGNVRAMHNLANLLATGINGKPDHAAALSWYSEAAEAGFRDSQFNAGLLLARGAGTKPDLPRAFHWFSLAATENDRDAARKRDEIAARLSAVELKAAKSALDHWRPRALDPVANEPPIAVEGQTATLDRTSGNKS